MLDARRLVIEFNTGINEGNLKSLARLMSQDHTFIDTAGTAVVGRRACLEAWSGFFSSYPGYQNHFQAIRVIGNVATIVGCSVCPGFPELEGPALWTALIGGDKLTQWRVYEDTPEQRSSLGIDDDWFTAAEP